MSRLVTMEMVVSDDGRWSSSEQERVGLLLRQRAGYHWCWLSLVLVITGAGYHWCWLSLVLVINCTSYPDWQYQVLVIPTGYQLYWFSLLVISGTCN